MTYTEKIEAILLEYGLYNDKMCDELAALIHQAIAEERERVRDSVGELTIYRNNKGVTEIEENTGYYKASEIDETLSSLDKPDKE